MRNLKENIDKFFTLPFLVGHGEDKLEDNETQVSSSALLSVTVEAVGDILHPNA